MAVALGEWLEGHALAAFQRIGADPTIRRAKWILAWIRRNRLKGFSLKKLHDNYRQGDAEDLLPALSELERRRFMRREPVEKRQGPGRKPLPSFVVNPATHAQNSQNSQNPLGPQEGQAFSEKSEFHEPTGSSDGSAR